MPALGAESCVFGRAQNRLLLCHSSTRPCSARSNEAASFRREAQHPPRVHSSQHDSFLRCTRCTRCVVKWCRTSDDRTPLLNKLSYTLNTNCTLSGVGLTFFYCFPDSRLPWACRYIQDNDLGKRQLPFSRGMMAGLYKSSYSSFEALQALAIIMERADVASRLRALLLDGRDELRRLENNNVELVKSAMKAHFRYDKFAHLRVFVAECSPNSHGASLAELLVHDSDVDVGLAYWRVATERVWEISLRRRDNDVNLNQLANVVFRKGGGHPGASGATVCADFVDLPGEIVIVFLLSRSLTLEKDAFW